MTDDRTTYIGGPGAAAVLGVNPYMTPVALWQFLTKRAPPVEVNDAMMSGRRLERAVLDYAGEELKTTVIPGPFVRDVKLPFAGHLDGIAEATGDIVEAKTSRTRKGWGEAGTDQIPQHVIVQALHYLGLVPGAQVCWVPVLFPGFEFELFKVERNDALVEQIKNLCWRWWQDYIVTDTPPPPTTGADALALFPRDTGSVVVADDATVAAVLSLRELKLAAKEVEQGIENCESRIKLALGAGAALSLPDGEIAATWKASKSHRFDSAGFKAAQPETYQQFMREIESRRFLLK